MEYHVFLSLLILIEVVMNKLLLIVCISLMSCSRLEYPIVTKYKEQKVKYVRIKETKPKHKLTIPMIAKEVTLWTILSIAAGYITLK